MPFAESDPQGPALDVERARSQHRTTRRHRAGRRLLALAGPGDGLDSAAREVRSADAVVADVRDVQSPVTVQRDAVGMVQLCPRGRAAIP